MVVVNGRALKMIFLVEIDLHIIFILMAKQKQIKNAKRRVP